MKVIGLVEEYEIKEQSDTQFTKHIRLRDDFAWFLSIDFKKLREGFEPISYKSLIKKKYPDPSPEQISTFWSTFLSIEREQESIPSEIDRDTVSGELLRQRLVETGKFQYDDAVILIERMYKLGAIDRVSYDTAQ